MDQTDIANSLNPVFNIYISYVMMRKCWEMPPDDRPSFKELYRDTSEYIEHIAGYLGLGYSPFSRMGMFSSTTELEAKQMEKEEEVESEVTIRVIPASVL